MVKKRYETTLEENTLTKIDLLLLISKHRYRNQIIEQAIDEMYNKNINKIKGVFNEK